MEMTYRTIGVKLVVMARYGRSVCRIDLQRKETCDKSEMCRKEIMVERIKPPIPFLWYICDPEAWNMNALHGGRLMAIVSFPSGAWDPIDTVD